jgi:hypothetical protein
MPLVWDADSCEVPEQGAHASGALLGPVSTEETACGGNRLPACPRDAVYCVRQGTGASFGVQVPGKIVGVRRQRYPGHAGQSGQGVEVLGSDLLCAEGRECRTASLRSVYKATVMSVLLFGGETWSLAPGTLKRLDSFHHRAAWQMAGMCPAHNGEGNRTYPSNTWALKKVGLHTIEHYIGVRQQTISNYIVNRPIFEHCWNGVRKRGSSPHPCTLTRRHQMVLPIGIAMQMRNRRFLWKQMVGCYCMVALTLINSSA